MKRILFVLKKSNKAALYTGGYDCSSYDESSGYSGYAGFGLSNSANLVANKLIQLGYEAKVVQVVDNNAIDKEVHEYNPDLVIIEALWVVPEKFLELLPLHLDRVWVVRIHSKTPFLAMEGIAYKWINGYNKIREKFLNFHISCNNAQFNDELNEVKNCESIYLPNIYHPSFKRNDYVEKPLSDIVKVASFGAIRPLKNQLIQAVAAMIFANRLGKTLHFYINGNRIEQSGDNVLKNIDNLFVDTRHQLKKISWLDHKQFVNFISKEIDIGMQISLSESFNIVAADFVYATVPLVVSPEIDWMPWYSQASPTDSSDIAKTLLKVWAEGSVKTQIDNAFALQNYNDAALAVWKDLLQSDEPSPSMVQKVVKFFKRAA